MVSPCYGFAAGKLVDCPKRHPNCHAECEDYKRFQAWKEKQPKQFDEINDYTHHRRRR